MSAQEPTSELRRRCDFTKSHFLQKTIRLGEMMLLITTEPTTVLSGARSLEIGIFLSMRIGNCT